MIGRLLRYLVVLGIFLLGSMPELTIQQVRNECLPGRFGPKCQYACHCKGSNSCNSETGSCWPKACADGYAGDGCQEADLAFQASSSSEMLVDRDVVTCDVRQPSSSYWIALHKPYWLRRFRIFTKDMTEDAQIFLQVTNSSAINPEFMASSNVRVTWSENGEAEVFLHQFTLGSHVWLRGHNLCFCEVYVFGGRNVALFRPTSQSSTQGTFDASLAVDGVTSQDFADNSCSQTQPSTSCILCLGEKVSWWRVNLTATYVVHRIVIYNRSGFSSRLRRFHLKVGSVDGRSWRSVHQSKSQVLPEVMDIIPARPLSVGLLQVELYGQRIILNLCELQMFGGCPGMTYGPSCNNSCDCADPQEVCDSFSGVCPSGQRGSKQTSSPIEVGGGGADHTITVVVVAAASVVSTVLVIAGVALAVWRCHFKRRRQNGNLAGPSESQNPEDDNYEEIGFPQGSAADGKESSKSMGRKPKLFHLNLKLASIQDRRRHRTQSVQPAVSAIYDDVSCSAHTCAQGSGNGDQYETLSSRDNETPYTSFPPVTGRPRLPPRGATEETHSCGEAETKTS